MILSKPCLCTSAFRSLPDSPPSAARHQASLRLAVCLFAIVLTVHPAQASAASSDRPLHTPPPNKPHQGLIAQTMPRSPQARGRTNAVGIDLPLIRNVLSAALNFIVPRTLEEHTVKDFCLWGLGGLSAVDPSLSFSVVPAAPTRQIRGTLFLLQERNTLFRHPLPADNDKGEWVTLTVSAIQTAWTHSLPLRQGGQNTLLQNFFDELFNHLDPYSRYLDPGTATDERSHREGQNGSVGLTLGQNNRQIVIKAVNINGPAWENGVDIGQVLLAVNGRSTHSFSAQTVQQWLSGPAHSLVTLTVADRYHSPVTLAMRRSVVPPETVFCSRSGRFPVLKVTSFSTETAEEVSEYLDQIMQDQGNKKPAGLILDLRGNRGGVLQQAVITAALLLDHGVAVTTHGRSPDANHIWAVQGGDLIENAPVAVLVDGRTASAAEILAAALADQHRAVVIGSETLGKGLVQIVGQMPNRGELFVTWSRNEAPLGWPIQGLGVMPQLCTSRGADYLEAQFHALTTGRSLQAKPLSQARAARYPVPVERILAIRQQCPAAIGGTADMHAARRLLSSPVAYKAALDSVPSENSVASLH